MVDLKELPGGALRALLEPEGCNEEDWVEARRLGLVHEVEKLSRQEGLFTRRVPTRRGNSCLRELRLWSSGIVGGEVDALAPLFGEDKDGVPRGSVVYLNKDEERPYAVTLVEEGLLRVRERHGSALEFELTDLGRAVGLLRGNRISWNS